MENITESDNHVITIDDDMEGISTAPSTQINFKIMNNKYELFERLLAFLDSKEELNPVLCGYFCKVFG